MSCRAVMFAFTTLALLAGARDAAADVKSCLDAAESAQSLRSQGQLVEAKRSFIACAAKSCPAPVRADCTRWLSEVDHAVPTIVVRVRDAERDAVDAALEVDGRPALLDGRPIELNPGKHVLRATAPGRAPVEETILLGQAERDRNVTMTLAPLSSRPAEPAPPRRAPVPLAAWVLLGGGVAALGAGVAFGVLGSGARRLVRADVVLLQRRRDVGADQADRR